MSPLVAALVALACSADPVRNAECRVACLWAGYDGGCLSREREDKCVCSEMKSYDAVTQKRLRPPTRMPGYEPPRRYAIPPTGEHE